MTKQISPTQKALNLWAVILIVWSIYRAKFQLPEWFDEFIAKPAIFILPVYFYVKRVEQKNFLSNIYFQPKLFLQDLSLGFFVAGIFFISAIFANYIKAGSLSPLVFKSFTFSLLLGTIIMAIATSISEEILSRGFILKRLYDDSKNILTASFFASILFFFLHVPILFTSVKVTGNLLLMVMTTDMILSFTNSLIFLQRKSLTLPILIHALYNLSIILFV